MITLMIKRKVNKLMFIHVYLLSLEQISKIIIPLEFSPRKYQISIQTKK